MAAETGAAEEETVTLVSYNRPLTRSARRALEEYGIEATEHPDEANRWSVVDVDERPPDDVLEQHELRIERGEPNRRYESDHGEAVEIYDDIVLVDGRENPIDPSEAIDRAEELDWERVDD